MREYGAGKLEFFISEIGEIMFQREIRKVKLVNCNIIVYVQCACFNMNEELFEISDAIISSLRQVSGVVNLYQFYFQVGGETVRIYT